MVASDHRSDSIIIPTPTAIPASTLPDIKTRWGQNGSAEPERSALIYAYIAAVLAWLFAVGAAVVALVKRKCCRGNAKVVAPTDQFGGCFDPPKIMASGGLPFIVKPGASFSTYDTGPVEYGTPATVKAARNEATKSALSPTMCKPQYTACENWRGWIFTFHKERRGPHSPA
jgi:hypothetical protein